MRSILTQNFAQRLVSTLMLLTLHAVVVIGLDSPVARSLIVAHLGLFLIWQPIWRGDQHLNWQNILIFAVLTGGFVIWLDWWLLAGWLILLIGLSGGRLPQNRRERNIDLVILFFLFIELLIGCASHMFAIRIDNLFISLFSGGMFFLPLLILVLPAGSEHDRQSTLQVDLFGALATALLASLLLLGSVISSHPLTDQNYITALVRTFLFIGVLILLISWLLSPKTGFSGLAELWTQSLLNIGTPFERWISEIASLKSETNTPEEFLQKSTLKLLTLPMIDGVLWSSTELSGRHGKETHNQVNINSEHLRVTIMTSRNIGATLLLHFKLLVRIIDHFYTAKQQEFDLARQAHMQAIHETGARITHDIKNILQSFHNITAIMNIESNGKSEATLGLLRKQLPILTQRLESALEKLQQPDSITITPVTAQNWWRELQLRHSHSDISFSAGIEIDQAIPRELFDTVAENLIENAYQKRDATPDLVIDVTFAADAGQITLSVRDSGEAMPEEIASRLFREPLKSAHGLGVGLLQSAEMARRQGYVLSLLSNEMGNVVFELLEIKNTIG